MLIWLRSRGTSLLFCRDKKFVAEYTEKSHQLLSQHYSLATKILDDAGTDYFRGKCM